MRFSAADGNGSRIFSGDTGARAKSDGTTNELGINDPREAGSRIAAGRNRGCTRRCRKARNNFAAKHQQSSGGQLYPWPRDINVTAKRKATNEGELVDESMGSRNNQRRNLAPRNFLVVIDFALIVCDLKIRFRVGKYSSTGVVK